jgi:hypothetical protein
MLRLLVKVGRWAEHVIEDRETRKAERLIGALVVTSAHCACGVPPGRLFRLTRLSALSLDYVAEPDGEAGGDFTFLCPKGFTVREEPR